MVGDGVSKGYHNRDDLTNKVMNAYSNTNKNEQVNKTNNEIKIQKTETPEQTETANNDVDKPKKGWYSKTWIKKLTE